ncbi:CoA-binding protein [Motiliproteus sp. SC1-56]|uniref:CoA-binding protein n=1 Tax=Motiliproteus sp. SC1-56 TaxID=2799565 RepID=UPI001A90B5FA|nr:CoA-binding protein [Motiliproteus sp. SC1-56]
MNDMMTEPSAQPAMALEHLEMVLEDGDDLLGSEALAEVLQFLGMESLALSDAASGDGRLDGWILEVRHTREFGMVVSAGWAGVADGEQADYFCPQGASVSVLAAMSSAQELLNLFRRTLGYRLMAERVDDAQLERIFASALALANRYAPGQPEAPALIERLCVGPIVATEGRMVPYNARCEVRAQKPAPAPRPIEKIGKLLHPASIGLVGVSASKMNFGRIILKNLLGSGYDPDRMTIIRPGEEAIDGVRCIDSLDALDRPLDLFIVAVGAEAVFDLVDEVIDKQAAEAVMLIPGGLGETEASRRPAEVMKQRINAAHASEAGGPVFLGGNCLGVVSHPGGYDSWFIPGERLPKPQKKQRRHSALISQSGAFMITRLSKNPWLDPAYMTALGNQTDLTHGDMLTYYADRDEIDTIGVYIEGFNELDGLAFAQAVRRAVRKGKQVVVYKAGRTDAGAAAARGHTASEAGDYSLCEALLSQAGALVARDFSEFDDLFYIASALHDKVVGGRRVAGVSGAGFETVGIADSIRRADAHLEVAPVMPATAKRLGQILAAKRLDALMEVRNPLDINPGADDEAHVECTRVFAEAENVDAVVVGLDPLSPMMRTLASSRRAGFDLLSPESVAQLLPPLVASQHKPIIGVVDGGPLYDSLAEALMDHGVCVFRTCERATAALARYTESRLYADFLRRATRD